MARGRELLIGVCAQPLTHERGDRGLAQRKRPDRQSARFGGDLNEQRILFVLLGGADAASHQHRKVLQTVDEVRQDPQ
jgi:hypothetical protein